MTKPYASQRTVSIASYATLRNRLTYNPWTGQLHCTKHGWPFVDYGPNRKSRRGGYALQHATCPFYYTLGPVPWYIEFNILLKRNQYVQPMLFADIIHMLVFRKPAPGPFFFLPSQDAFLKFVQFMNEMRHRTYSPHFYSDFQVPNRAPLDCIAWFNPKNPYITWEPHFTRWRLKYYDRRTKQRISSTYGPWCYWQAVQRFQTFLLDTCGYTISDLSPELIAAASGFEIFLPKAAEEPHRLFSDLLGEPQRGPEHPRDPYWFHAWNARRDTISARESSPDALSFNELLASELDGLSPADLEVYLGA